MDQDKELQQIKERLSTIEKQIQEKSRSSNVSKFIIGFVVVFILMMFLIGIVQFISTQP
ncbi:hypothetical protein [Paenibacillus silviterrae]|uniref:hypothetical protein n=1 Tax=Paenibacillus silviterrae TaxID=3242194 RepID=UPI0025426FA6|nr:hypothetical protein [Paenibacillus chinjuensis]